MMKIIRAILYPCIKITSRVLSNKVALIHKIKLNRIWKLMVFFLPKSNGFYKSVYGPYLLDKKGDHQSHLCIIGKSGFKLSDLINSIDSNVVFMDIGSNVGLYSLVAANNKNITSIFAVEPNPIIVDSFKRNIAQNNIDNIYLYEGAISQHKGEIELNYDDWHLGMGSIERGGKYKVSVNSYNREFIDKLFADVSDEIFIKIDVEGAEWQVLEEIFSSRYSSLVTKVFVEITPKWLSPKQIERIYSLFFLNGFRLKWRSKGNEQYDAYFVKDNNYVLSDNKKRERIENILTIPRYTICVPNYNMDDTIYSAISSVAIQLDERFEILIIDDGSNDNSRSEIRKLELKFPIVRSIFLAPDRKRHLGETRNYSIYSALGEYVLLHIDADDLWQPYLKDVVTLFHKLESAYEKDFLLVGQQTGIAKRSLMLESGGYENIYRGEDRNMMINLAAMDKILFMDYKTFRKRMSRPTNKKLIKRVWDMCSHMDYALKYDCSSNNDRAKYIIDALIMSYNDNELSNKLRLLRMILILPVWLNTCFSEKADRAMTWDEFLKFREPNRGNYESLMRKAGYSSKLTDILDESSIEIFDYEVSNSGFKGE